MILNPIWRAYGPLSINFAKRTRNLKSTVKICKESFQITLDVRQFRKDEIKVKAHPEYVIIEGKSEIKSDKGYIMRHFVKKFKLPEGCVHQKIKSTLTPEGILTVCAPRTLVDENLSCETVTVPINYFSAEKLKEIEEEKKKALEKELAENQKAMKEKEEKDRAERLKNYCAEYPKVKPKSDK